jgi:hypothetical protein
MWGEIVALCGCYPVQLQGLQQVAVASPMRGIEVSAIPGCSP